MVESSKVHSRKFHAFELPPFVENSIILLDRTESSSTVEAPNDNEFVLVETDGLEVGSLFEHLWQSLPLRFLCIQL